MSRIRIVLKRRVLKIVGWKPNKKPRVKLGVFCFEQSEKQALLIGKISVPHCYFSKPIKFQEISGAGEKEDDGEWGFWSQWVRKMIWTRCSNPQSFFLRSPEPFIWQIRRHSSKSRLWQLDALWYGIPRVIIHFWMIFHLLRQQSAWIVSIA